MSDTKDLAELSVIAALMFGLKEAMNFLPNIHPLMPFIISTALVYGIKALYPVICFVLLEMAVHGFGIWSISYLYVWPLAVLLVLAFRKQDSRLFWAAFSASYGFLFGALCSLPYLFTSGFKAAFAYWIAGIPFDLLHGVSNFFISAALLPLFMKLMKQQKTAEKKTAETNEK